MRKKQSVLLAIVLVLSLCLGLAACGGSSGTAGGDAPAGNEGEAAGGGLIGVSMPTKSLQRWNQDGDNLKTQLEARGYEVDLQYADGAQVNDVPTQINQIENMITKECKVLVIAAIDGEALSDVLQQAADAEIPVISYDRLIRETPNITYYVSFDNYKVGQLQGTYLVENLDLANAAGPFNIEVFGGDPGDNNARMFYQGAIDALQPFIDSGKVIVKSGQVDFDVVAINGWESAGAQDRMDNLFTAYYADGTKLDAVLSPNDSLALGIAASFDNNGFGAADKPYPMLTGQDCDVANVVNMINGKQAMDVFKDTRLLAENAVEMVDAIGQGKEPEINNTTDYDNGVFVVPSYLRTPVPADLSNFKELLLSDGYYSGDNAKTIEDAAAAAGK